MKKDHTAIPPFEISWVDDDTIKYAESGRHVLININVKPGLLSGARVIDAKSIVQWVSLEDGSVSPISSVDRQVIVYRLEGYDPVLKRRFRVCKGSPDDEPS